MTATSLDEILHAQRECVLVDVREPYEQRLGVPLSNRTGTRTQTVALSGLLNALPAWRDLPAETLVIFYCRSGNRTAQAARALRLLGHSQAWSLQGGLALWPDTPKAVRVAEVAAFSEPV